MTIQFQSCLFLGLLACVGTTVGAQAALPKAKAKAKPGTTAPKPQSDQQKLHYLAGFNIGQRLRADFPDLDETSFIQGMRDARQGKTSPISPEETKTLFTNFQKQKQEEGAKRAEASLKAGQAFLAENKSKEGVVSLPSGVQYRVLQAAEGEKPTAADKVVAHYRGSLLSGKEFDSSHKRNEPTTFPVKGVIPAWQQVLPLMTVGSKWQVWAPADQAYGPRGAGADIGPNETLVFEIELLKILKEAPKEAPKELPKETKPEK
jgi:FKBP-type peptidyl-prolyl cis-trans isomerase FklB